MTKKSLGPIPKKVTYLSPGARKIKVQEWDDEDDETVQEEHEVFPAFISDAENELTLASGKTWVDRHNIGKHVRNTDGTYTWVHANNKNLSLTVDNVALTNVRILSLEKRSEGGRAYKVIIPLDGKNFYVDLREDVLVDTMKSVGIQPGAILNGEFIWGKDGSQTKLIRIGSALHSRLVKSTKQSAQPALSLTSLIPGHVYAAKTFTALYCGKMSDKELSMQELKEGRYSSCRPHDTLDMLQVKVTNSGHYWIDVHLSEYNHVTGAYTELISEERRMNLKMEDIVKDRVGQCFKSRKVIDDIGIVVDFDQQALIKIMRKNAIKPINVRRNYLTQYFNNKQLFPTNLLPSTHIGHMQRDISRSYQDKELYVDQVELRTYALNSLGQFVQTADGEKVSVNAVFEELLTHATDVTPKK